MKKIFLSSIIAATVVSGLLTPYALAQMGGFNYTAVAHSGEKTMVSHHHSSQFQGNPIPYTLKPLTSPKNGTISIERGTYLTKVFYQSKKDFVGQDSFQFVRVSDDRFAGTYTVAVTVK
jgi:hypothetical protein